MTAIGNVLKINGVGIKDPSSITPSRNKEWSQNSGRTKSGNFVGDIAAMKWKLDLTWAPLTEDEMQTLLTALEPAFISVRFKNPRTKSFETKTFYGGSETMVVYNYNVEEAVYENLSVSLVEK